MKTHLLLQSLVGCNAPRKRRRVLPNRPTSTPPYSRSEHGLPRRKRFGIAALLVLGISATAASHRVEAQAPRRLNVLMIAVDDLKPTLGCYGDSLAITPSIDRLAARGMVFNRAYCQQAVCSPSRNSLLTGRRPDTIKIYDLATHFRTTLPDVVTLPQHFKQNGYHSEGMGKIYHVGHGNYDDVHSWSIPSWPASRRGPLPKKAAPGECAAQPQPQRKRQMRRPTREERGPAYAAPDVPDNGLFDGKLAEHAVERLRVLKGQDRPFFMAVGFLKPHLPFIAPKKHWDRYDPAKIRLSPTRELPAEAPRFAGNGSGELRTYDGTPLQGPVPAEMARTLIHGYYACVSYMDAQVGKILDEVDRLGLRENTVVALWGDHGWHLGDHGLWCKHTNFEQATRAPLIVSAPGMRAAGKRTNALVEFVDLYPSLCELAGVAVAEGLEGASFKPLLEHPERPWKSAAFSQYPRGIPMQGAGMGHSIRTDRYRLTEWTVPGKGFTAVELYDYRSDPEETVNLAGRPEHAALVAELKQKLRQPWQSFLPKLD